MTWWLLLTFNHAWAQCPKVLHAYILCMYASCGCFILPLSLHFVCLLPFLQVAVARMRSTHQVYALKIMNKWDMLRRGEVNTQTHKPAPTFTGQRIWPVFYVTYWAERKNLTKVLIYHVSFYLSFISNCLFCCVLYSQHVTKRRGRFCWGVIDTGSLSCTMPFRMTTIWYVGIQPIIKWM